MFRRPIFWIAMTVLCAVAAWCLWQRGNRSATAPVAQAQPGAAPNLAASQSKVSASTATNAVARTTAPRKRLDDYRLSNTSESLDTLTRRDSALLLENARWDTTLPLDLKIPAHLRAQGDPGTYVVKSAGPMDAHFRELLRRAGLTLVSYIPHDALLVRGSESQVAFVRGQAGVAAVVAWEPYFKLKSVLLPMAVEQEPMPAGTYLNVVLFGDARAATVQALEGLGASVLAEGPSPFGPVLTVQARPESLVALAQLPGVQSIQRSAARAVVNDLARVSVGVAVNTTTTNNYFGLTGTNVLVAMADSGVDMTHPDLIGRVITNTLLSAFDTAGHGTHVASIIAGDGSASTTVVNPPSGSVAGASYRGKAPAAKIYSMRLGEAPFAGLGFDAYAQQQAAASNAFIMNHSWGEVGVYDYDILAASYDASVRDAQPFQPGSQPVLSIFSAGNDGGGADNGLDGVAGTVLSPATGKNSIAVGALEQLRNITNKVILNGATNAVWESGTDSDRQVASYSARGNVGIGVEGVYGRVKPDLVAPGSWVVAARSAQWDEGSYYSITNRFTQVIDGQTLAVNGLNQYSIFAPPECIGLSITVTPTDLSTNNTQTNFPIYVSTTTSATTTDTLRTNVFLIPSDLPLTPGSGYFYAVGNPYRNRVGYTITTVITVTNELGDYFRVLKQLNDGLGGKYRFESGTSMAAPAASGVLALMQEYFATWMQRTNSPALMKALLINGARSASAIYDMQVQNSVNHQGWGLVNLPTSLPPTTNVLSTNASSFLFFDQSPTNALATGQSQTRLLTLNNNSQNRPLRVTLVWTDPPGNPSAGVKLVNDLDLVVTNLDTKEVYFGNDIPANSDFTSIYDTNKTPVIDVINNVENVFIAQPLGTNFSITVNARRVNVNAVTAHTNDIVQDYALVISSGNGEVTNSFSVAENPILTNTIPFVTFVTNNADSPLPLFNQTAGANAPLLSGLNGMTNQWHFFVVTNYGTNANFTNAAFLTFLPPTLATPRMGVRSSVRDEHSRLEADLDMYVSQNPALTNLDPTAIAAADKSLGRGGTEVVVYSNSAPGQVYYVGIKSEDQMAGQFAFYALFSDQPFNSTDANGNVFLRGIPAPAIIPDGTPAKPGTALLFGIATQQIKVRRVTVTNIITHENFGDLYANLSHNNSFAVLHNHSFGDGSPTQQFVYDDSGQGDLPGSKKSDGPGSLQNFVGQEGIGLWLVTVLDDSPSSTGRVEQLTIKIEPQDLEGNGDILTIAANSWGYDFIDVPLGATNLMIGLTWPSGNALPVDLYIRRGDFPDFNNYDKKTTVFPPGGTNVLSVTKFDLPPLQPGTYYIGVYNPNAVSQTVKLTAHIDIDLNGVTPIVYSSIFPVPLLDDAVTNGEIFVSSTQRVTSVEVGVAIRHPRVSDLALQLVSPGGKRVLLFENRGGTDTNGLGSVTITTNVFPATTSGGAAAHTNTIPVGSNQGTLLVNYTFFSVPDQMRVYYDGALIYDTGLVPGTNVSFGVNFGPGISSNLVITMNEGGNADTNTAWNYDATVILRQGDYFTFTEDTNKSPTLLKFTPPPFAKIGGVTTLVASGFETAAAGSYAAPSTFEGWTVTDTNQVGVVADAVNARTGTQFLALADGRITRSVATQPGRDYIVQYAYRGPGSVGWWRGEGNGNDQINGNSATTLNGATYGPGEVGQGFVFDGVDDQVKISASAPLDVGLGAGFTIEFWMKPSQWKLSPLVEWNDGLGNWGTHFWQTTVAPGDLYANIWDTGGNNHQIWTGPGVLQTNIYQHAALTYDKLSGQALIFANGNVVASTNFGTFTPQTSYDLWFATRKSGAFSTDYYPGSLDEVSVYNRALSPAELKAIALRGAAGKFDPAVAAPSNLAEAMAVFGTQTNVFYGSSTNWQVQTLTFRAVSNTTPLDFQGIAPGMLLDDITVTEQPRELFVLPEETLTAFKGDNAFGTWKLEVWDSRVGATNPAPELTGWQLSFLFEQSEGLPINLQTGVTVTNSIPPGQMQILIVDVPPWANVATNSLIFADLPLLVWFNQNAAPQGTNPPDLLFFGGSVTNGVQTIVTNGAPPLLPGQRYYIGLQNTNIATATFAFRVDFDITALTNTVPYSAITTSNGIPRYFTYDVSSNASAVAFDLYGMDGNLNLVARQGAPPPDLLGYDYGSFNPGTNNEQILVLTNSSPVALRPGVWYLGVFNTTAAAVNYTIRATEFTNAIPTIITLTNQVPYTVFTNNGALGSAEYYRYVVTPTAARAQFEIFGATGDFTLVAHRSLPLPDLFTFDYLSGNAGTNDELIVVLTNSSPVALSPGDWFLSAVKLSAGPASYNIMATEWNTTGQPITITNIDVSTGQFCITWNSLPGVHYVVQSTPVLNPTAWVDASPTITAVDYITTYCVPITGTMMYFRVIEGVASAPAAVPAPTITSVRVTPGGVVLTWYGPVLASYHVQWTDSLTPLPLTWNTVTTPVTSTNGIFTFTDDGSQTSGLNSPRFYRLTAP